jgi:predicted nucleic acid-binding Zn ribbon protein
VNDLEMQAGRISRTVNFHRLCTYCGTEVPPDRLARGSDTCSVECKRKDRISQRRFQKRLALERVISSPRTRRLVTAREAQEQAERSAPEAVCSGSRPFSDARELRSEDSNNGKPVANGE